MSKLIYTGASWTQETIDKLWTAMDKIAREKYGLTYEQPQLEIVSAHQMVQLSSTNGLPVTYPHWSTGKKQLYYEQKHKAGDMHAALEMIINTVPPIAYLCEQNSATIQAMVLAHACCGHASLFKNNYIFQKYGDPQFILSYMKYARKYILECEKRYGVAPVERILDAAHALMFNSIDKHQRRYIGKAEQADQAEVWKKFEEESFNYVFDMIEHTHTSKQRSLAKEGFNWKFPEENILYFIEKNGPNLEPWQREVLRIVRKLAEWIYPVIKTKLIHEGWATFWEYILMTDLYDEGYIDEGAYLEFLHWHTAVNNQPAGTLPQPYALGTAMFNDIKRICEKPTPTDYEEYPLIAGKSWVETILEIGENYNDEDFIRQYLTPKVIKDYDLMTVHASDADLDDYEVAYTTDREDWSMIRKAISKHYSTGYRIPSIEIVDYDIKKDRELALTYTVIDGILLDERECRETVKYLHKLWGHPVHFQVFRENGEIAMSFRRVNL